MPKGCPLTEREIERLVEHLEDAGPGRVDHPFMESVEEPLMQVVRSLKAHTTSRWS